MDRLRILVVDDLSDGADSMAFLLEQWNHKLVVVNEGKKAIEIARTVCPDVVFLDLGLPDIPGFEVARQLRTSPTTASALLVAITGCGQAAAIQQCQEVGIDLHFLKPVDPEEIKKVLETWDEYLLSRTGCGCSLTNKGEPSSAQSQSL
jgi:CheY-like chemotaxis protein